MRNAVEKQNLKCSGFGNSITNWVNALNDVKDVSVDVQNDAVSFSYTVGATFDMVRKTLSTFGYPTFNVKNILGKKANSYVGRAIGKM